jgi:hypothetical protein
MRVWVDAHPYPNRSRVAGLVVLAVLCVPAPGCKKASSSDATAPDSREGDAASADAQSDDPLAELDALEGQMRAFGLATASAGPDDAAGGEAAPRDDASEAAPAPAGTAVDNGASVSEETGARCGDLCDLSESICLLEVKICGLSEAHATDSIYADACERAVDDCHTAGQACDDCDA